MSLEFNPQNSYGFNDYKFDKIEASKPSLEKFQDPEKLEEACREFESIFIYMMMKEMKKTVPSGGFFEKSHARDIFEDMYLEETSENIANTGDGIGLAKSMYDNLIKDGRVIIK